MPNVEKDNMIDLPSDGPDVEVTLPEETVKEGAQEGFLLKTIPC